MPTPNTMACYECGAVLNKHTARRADGTLHCESCVRNWLQRNPDGWYCQVCGEYHNGNVESFTIEYSNGERKRVCNSCLNRWAEEKCWNVDRCERCGAFTPSWKREVISLDGERRMVAWCASCAREHSHQCRDCGRILPTEEMWNAGNGAHYCPHCARNHGAWQCDECETWNSQNQTTCGECGRARPRRKDPQLRDVLGYHQYGRIGKEYVGRKVANEEPLFFGVELETSRRGEIEWPLLEPWIDNEHSPMIHAESDSSITGWEWISQPCTLKYWQEKSDISALCTALRSMGVSAESRQGYPIGMHIHITKKKTLMRVMQKLDMYVANEKELWQAISRRRTIYKGGWSYKRAPLTVEEMRYPNNRYAPVNFSPTFTVELRTPRGTLDPSVVLGTIEWLHCVIKALQYVNINDLRNEWHLQAGKWTCCVREVTRNVVLPHIFANKDDYPHAVRMVRRILKKNRLEDIPEMRREAKKKAWLKDHKPGEKRSKKAKKAKRVFVFTTRK